MPETSPKILEIFKRYKQAAIDFSRRNRLLKYPSKALKIEFKLTLEECLSHFGLLEELKISFNHKKILKEEKDHDEPDLQLEEVEYDTKTFPGGKKLISTLERMRLQSKKSFDEHGLHTLFIAFGEVCWREKTVGRGSTEAVKQQDYIAPLLLVPVSLENEKDPHKTTILSIDTNQHPVQINPVLLLFIKENFDLRLPNIPETQEDILAMPYTEVRKILKEIKEIFTEKGIPAELSEKIYLGQFSFHGQQIYEDLNKNQDEILKHDFINGICGGESFHQDNSYLTGIDAEEFNPDSFLTKEEDFTIVDADGSQIQAIRKIVSGDHMVIHGPPGTGKSQTIANVISNLLARQKKVLFVCEKQVALDVVYKRLTFDEASVSNLCLPLFNYTNDKKSFAADLIHSRDEIYETLRENRGVDLATKLKSRQKRIDALKSYGALITVPVAPLGKNIYWIFGELSKINDLSKEIILTWKGENPLNATLDDYRRAVSLIQDMNGLADLFNEKTTWSRVNRIHYTIDFSRRVIEALKEIETTLLTFGKEIDIADFIDLQSLKGANAFIDKEYGSITASYPKIKSLDVKYLENAQASIDELIVKKTAYKSLVPNGNLYIFPENWDVLKIINPILLNKESSVSQILSPKTFSTLDNLAVLKKDAVENIPSELLNFSINDFKSKEELFRIDSYLSPLANASRTQIYELRNQFKNLETLYTQIQSSQAILDKYGIGFSEIDPKKIIALENIFSEKYKNFFRVFSKSYKANRTEIASWCILRKPEKYSEIKSIITSLAFRTKTQSKYEDDWSKILETFRLSDTAKHLSFDRLHEAVNCFINYFEDRNLEYIEPLLKESISDSRTHAVLAQKVSRIKEIVSNWSSLVDIVLPDIGECSLGDIGKTMDLLQNEVDELKVVFEKVSSFIIGIENSPQTILALNDHIAVLNQALQIIDDSKDCKINTYIDSSASDLLLSDETVSSFDAYLKSISIFLEYLVPNFIQKSPSDLLSLVVNIKEKSQTINEWYDNLDAHLTKIAALFENDQTEKSFLSKSHRDLLVDVSGMANDAGGLERWIEYKKKRHALQEISLGWFIDECARLSVDNNLDLSEVYTWTFFNKWIDVYSDTHHELRDFTIEKYQKLIQEFKELEKESMEINRLRILYGQMESLDESIVPCDAERVLRREAKKKMRHLPIRSLVQKYASHIQLMKPCWMVSPLALSSYLEYGKVSFDVVIFDEASQMKIENALGAIARSKQTVVIGDEHQLPPTSFFGVSLEGDEDEDDEASEETGFESILQKSISMLNGSESYLKYHYRSSSEDLIAFSNYHIYGNRLITFPNPQNSKGVEFKFVPGVYDGSVITYGTDGQKERHAGARTNLVEAAEVAKLCIEHVQATPEKTIGVIAFSKAQEQAIRDAVEEKVAKEYPHLSEFLDETSEKKDSFFIKNLESVQGDERDVIILSICYGPNKLGEVRNHFGPINSASGYRRLNVAVTRAKDKLICVTSMRFSDMSPSPNARGAMLLQKYLEYAEKGWKILEGNLIAHNGTIGEHDSDFEACVEKALVDIGYTVHRQIGVSGFKIDLAILNPKNNVDYILGIECDGAAYHSSKSARVRDRMRQDILEERGWHIYRIWSQHWYMHKQEVLSDIVQYVQRLVK